MCVWAVCLWCCPYSDSVPIFGYRRRSYLFLCGITGGLGWLGMATFVNEPKLALAMLTLGSLGTAVSDVVVDSIVVERARGEGQTMAGQLQSICWASAAVGGLVSAYFSGSLLQDFGPRYVRPAPRMHVFNSMHRGMPHVRFVITTPEDGDYEKRPARCVYLHWSFPPNSEWSSWPSGATR